MTKFLIRLFIGKTADYSSDTRKKYGFLSGITGIILNLLLFTGKLIAGILSGAVSVVADALNNLSDAGSSIVNMVGFKIAMTPPDREHPFGHGRAEYVAGLIISFIITLMGVELAKSSVDKIIVPEAPDISVLTFVILFASVLVKLWMFFFNRKLGSEINSVSLKATASDSISDVTATVAVILGMAASVIFDVNIDGWAGLLVSVFIVVSGLKTAKESLSPLMGQMPEKELVEDIKSTVNSYEGIIGMHDLIVHNYGVGISFISFHAEVASSMPLSDAHTLVDGIETEFKKKFGCGVTIHIDPVDIDDEETTELFGAVKKVVKGIDEGLSIHDFRVVKNHAGNTLIFDLAVPYKFRLSDRQIREMTVGGINAIDKNAVPIVSIERQLAELD
ncbi:MAG: cation transporter [Ruminiclostridium sp.]|jgi:cation diffusion facilitator family transporter|nr:cation transporter [Ruminiclostridium sp.]